MSGNTPIISDLKSILSIYKKINEKRDAKASHMSRQEYEKLSSLNNAHMLGDVASLMTSVGLLGSASMLSPTATMAFTAYTLSSLTIKSGIALMKNKQVVKTHKTKRPIEERVLRQNDKLLESILSSNQMPHFKSYQETFHHSMDLSTSLQLAYSYNEVFFNLNKRNQYAPKMKIFEKGVDFCKGIIQKANEFASKELSKTLNKEEKSLLRTILSKPLEWVLTEKFKASIIDHETKNKLFNHIKQIHDHGEEVIDQHYTLDGDDPYQGQKLLREDIDETIKLTYSATLAASSKNQLAYCLGSIIRNQVKLKDMPIPKEYTNKQKEILNNIASLHHDTGEEHYRIMSQIARDALTRIENGEKLPVPKKWSRTDPNLTDKNMETIFNFIDTQYTKKRSTPPSSKIEYFSNFKTTFEAVILGRSEKDVTKKKVQEKAINPDHLLKLEKAKEESFKNAVSEIPFLTSSQRKRKI